MSSKSVRLSTFLLGVSAVSLTVLAHEIGHEYEHVEGGWNARGGFVSYTDITAKLWTPRGKSHEEIDKRAEFVEQSFEGVNDLSFEAY